MAATTFLPIETYAHMRNEVYTRRTGNSLFLMGCPFLAFVLQIVWIWPFHSHFRVVNIVIAAAAFGINFLLSPAPTDAVSNWFHFRLSATDNGVELRTLNSSWKRVEARAGWSNLALYSLPNDLFLLQVMDKTVEIPSTPERRVEPKEQ